jgi:hypothetical protein
MPAFHFKNSGLLPIEAITTLGVSVKEGDNSIGRFGTGLKYTIAGVLRLGEEISIQVGPIAYYFSSEIKEVRGKPFQFVNMTIIESGKEDRTLPLGFTTDLGKHWLPWMFIRELWSNMKDERGSCDWGLHPGGPNETVITLKGYHVEEAFRRIKEYIITDELPVTANSYGEHYGGERADTIFFQGISIGATPKPVLRKYNLARADLTEDRTMAYPGNIIQSIVNFIALSDDRKLIERYVTLQRDSGYWELDGTLWVGDYYSSETFREVVKFYWENKSYMLHPKVHQWASTTFAAPASAKTWTLSPVENSKFEKALAFIKKLGFDKETPWTFVDPDDKTVYGWVEDDTIYLTRMAFQNGTQFLAQTMIEEYLHHHSNLDDYTRAFQDALLRKLVSLGEEWLGETL